MRGEVLEDRLAVRLHLDGVDELHDPGADVLGVGEEITRTTRQVQDEVLTPDRCFFMHLQKSSQSNRC